MREYVVSLMSFRFPETRGKRERIAHLRDSEAIVTVLKIGGQLRVTVPVPCRKTRPGEVFVVVEEDFKDKYDFRLCRTCTGEYTQTFRTSDEPWYMKGAFSDDDTPSMNTGARQGHRR